MTWLSVGRVARRARFAIRHRNRPDCRQAVAPRLALDSPSVRSPSSPRHRVAPVIPRVTARRRLQISFISPLASTSRSGGNVLYVANSDFDLQYNGGTIQSYDLNAIRHDVVKTILESDRSRPCPLVRPAHAAGDPPGNPCLGDAADVPNGRHPGSVSRSVKRVPRRCTRRRMSASR